MISIDFPTLERPRQNRAQPAARGGLEFHRRDPTRQSSVAGALGEANPGTKGVARAKWMAWERGVGYELDMSWISQQWWPKDGVIILSYIDVFLAVPEVLNGFLWLLQRSLEIVWNYFEHVWRSLRRTSRVSRKQRLLMNFLWLHAFFHGTACYCFLWLLRNDARRSSQFSELVEMCDSRCQWLHCDSTFWMYQFTL